MTALGTMASKINGKFSWVYNALQLFSLIMGTQVFYSSEQYLLSNFKQLGRKTLIFQRLSYPNKLESAGRPEITPNSTFFSYL